MKEYNGIFWVRTYTFTDSNGNTCRTRRLPHITEESIERAKRNVIEYGIGCVLGDKNSTLDRCFLMLRDGQWKVGIQEYTFDKELMFGLDEFLDIITIKKLECID